MFRFSIRDLFWATLVVALGLGWWLHYRAVEAKRQQAIQGAQNVVEYANQLKGVLQTAKLQSAQQISETRYYSNAAHKRGAWLIYTKIDYQPDWTVLDKPIPPLE